MPTRLSIFILFIAALFASCSKDLQESENSSTPADLEISNSLSNLRISNIAEDANGYIWIGTSRGLNRFNGDEMHQYFCNDQPNSIPDNRINSVFCDSKGRVWITTKNGVARYTDQDDFEQIPINFSNPRTQKMVETSRGDIFAIQTNEILKYNQETNAFEKAISEVSSLDPFMQEIFVDEEDNLWVVDDHNIASYSTTTYKQLIKLELDANVEIQTAALIGRQLWFGDSNGLHIYDVVKHEWQEVPEAIRTHYLYNKARLHGITATQAKNILISSADGLFLYVVNKQQLLHESDPQFPFAAPIFPVTMAFSDSQGNLWFGSTSQGYAVRQSRRSGFNAHTTFTNAMLGKPIVAMSLDHQDVLWVATQDEGLYSYDLKTSKTHHFEQKDLLNASHKLPTNRNRSISCLYVDQNDDIWVATVPRGAVQLRRKGDQLEFISYHNLPAVIVMKEDKDGTLWAGCYGNSYYSKRKSDSQFLEHHLFSNTFSYLSCMELLHDGTFATLMREQGLRYINPETQEQTSPVIPDSVLQACIKRNIFLPSALKEDADGKLWIGTVSNGLMCYDPEEKTLENIKGAPCEDIASIEIDNDGNLWISTQYGIGKYNTKTQLFTNYYSTDGLSGNEYFDRASCKLPNGTLVFGGPQGLTSFDPQNVPEAPEGGIYLEDLKVHNQLIRPRKSETIDRQLSLCDAINLNYDQKSFSITFSAHDFNEEERYNYQYMLEGFNSTWVDANNNREAFYANIRPGCYTFRARITNKDRDRIIAETSIPVIISAPWWGTWWAWLLYIVFGLTILIYIVRLYRGERKEKWNRLQSQREKEQEHRINQMNMSFFANVSHEFRTPLTVISGPISQLCQDDNIKGEDHHLLLLVNRSVNRMLHLVNQMMDFHKLENDTLRLEVKRQDIVGYLKQSAEFFGVNAKDKNISFSTHGLDDYFLMWMDADKIDKIMNNLLGNAMKYTPAKGEVSLSFDVVTKEEVESLFDQPEQMTDSQYVKICVTDNGPGIPEEKREKIFKRYYQLQNHNNGNNFNWGTGIGLYFARSLALLHHGALRVLDNPEGQGSQFVLVLPINKSAYKENEFADQEQNQNELFPLQQQVEVSKKPVEEESSNTSENQDKPHLLVIDDDVEVIHYLKLLLGQDYRVTCRFDAVTALETLQRQEQEVDLIISDVMMPGTTGYQLCQQVKDDPQLCHIPVILVTAKTTVQDQVEGLKAGALAYVSKPFDPSYLMALIHRLLDSRNHTRQLLKENTQTDALDENALSSQDNAFMTELYRLMEEELANPDMDITRMTELLHISRSKLYYKIKGLTGENPSVFFKQYKLNRAAELLKEGKYNISEISLLTGFNTLSHFSTSFKKQFGVAPSEYC